MCVMELSDEEARQLADVEEHFRMSFADTQYIVINARKFSCLMLQKMFAGVVDSTTAVSDAGILLSFELPEDTIREIPQLTGSLKQTKSYLSAADRRAVIRIFKLLLDEYGRAKGTSDDPLPTLALALRRSHRRSSRSGLAHPSAPC
jgi:hypothetical protein